MISGLLRFCFGWYLDPWKQIPGSSRFIRSWFGLNRVNNVSCWMDERNGVMIATEVQGWMQNTQFNFIEKCHLFIYAFYSAGFPVLGFSFAQEPVNVTKKKESERKARWSHCLPAVFFFDSNYVRLSSILHECIDKCERSAFSRP